MADDSPVMYGIPNCGSIKKARSWLDEHALEYRFHDFKKLGLDEKKLKGWAKSVGWETLLNRKGTTWRKLDQTTRDNIDESSAIALMLNNPSIIKRPVLEFKDHYLIGFDAEKYAEVFTQQ